MATVLQYTVPKGNHIMIYFKSGHYLPIVNTSVLPFRLEQQPQTFWASGTDSVKKTQ